MAILRLSDGRIYSSFEDINRIVAPLSVGSFHLPKELAQQMDSMNQPLGQQDTLTLLNSVPQKDREQIAAAGLQHKRVGAAVPNEDGSVTFVLRDENTPADVATPTMSEEQLGAYLVPHHVMAKEWHFVFRGAVVKGVYISDDLQGVVYCPAGNWMRLDSRVLSWVMFAQGEPTIAVGYFDVPCDAPFEMKVRDDITVLPTMKF